MSGPTSRLRAPSRRIAPAAIATLLVLSATFVVAGCSRALGVETEPGPTYMIEVVNPADQPMIVSYDDGSGERLLGTVPAGREEYFTIANPARRTIRIIAVDRDRERTIRETVTLRPGDRVRVVLSA